MNQASPQYPFITQGALDESSERPTPEVPWEKAGIRAW